MTAFTAETLYDFVAHREFALDYPGLTAQDVLDFCEYFLVTFYSLSIASTPQDGLGSNDMFRVTTSDYPARGKDVTFRSVVSWLECRKVGYRCAVAGDHVSLIGHGNVEVVCEALPMEPSDLGKVVVFKLADGTPRYLAAAKFVGVTYDRTRDIYETNARLVRAAAVGR